jgi:hypothetical protein
VTRPSLTSDCQRIPALRFGDPRVTALMSAIAGFCHLVAEFDIRTLNDLMANLLGSSYTTRQATYDLRRCAARESSNGCRTATATSSRRWADASRSSSPRPTAACSHPA